MKLSALTLLTLFTAFSAVADEQKQIVCYSGGKTIYEGCAASVYFGPNQVTFSECRGPARVWIHAECVVTWKPAVAPR